MAGKASIKRLFFTVTNDLTYDQRMDRICSSLAGAGYDVTLIGRKRSNSTRLEERKYRQVRLICWFNKGKLFYLEYNFRLFFYLLMQKFDVICGIDLDTILPTWLVSKLRRKKFVYDAHEFFTEMEEVVSRPLVKKAWLKLEQLVLPKVKYAYTVSGGYAHLFEERYGTSFEIIRNATLLNGWKDFEKPATYILYQGAVNVGRGLEELIKAMKQVESTLIICGKGDIYDKMISLTKELNLGDKITFKGYIEPKKLKEYTWNATIGITFFAKEGLSNKYSLANRFFDYMHAAIPQVAMNFPEYKQINEQFEVAMLIDDLDENIIANALNHLLQDKAYYQRLKNNCIEARKEYNWQNEEKKLLKFYENITESA